MFFLFMGLLVVMKCENLLIVVFFAGLFKRDEILGIVHI
jgi:hypothetical protein